MPAVIASTTAWQVGIAVGIAVIAVAAVDCDHDRAGWRGGSRSRPGRPSKRSRSYGSRPTSSAASLGSTTRASGSCTPPGRCGRWRSGSDGHAPRALLERVLDDRARHRRGRGRRRRDPARRAHRQVRSIEKSVDGLLEVAGSVGANTANIPQLQATAPVLGLIVTEAVVQDGYMNALTDGYGGR